MRTASSSSLQLLLRAQRGDRQALEELFDRVVHPLRRWARGRLPRWARERGDTADVVQDVLAQAFRHLGRFEPRRQRALQAYLRQCVKNRIRDEVRWAGRHDPVPIDDVDLTAPAATFDQVVDRENRDRYLAALKRLEPAERELIVARLELGYSYDQVALVTNRKSPDAARVAIRRALLRLAEEMPPG